MNRTARSIVNSLLFCVLAIVCFAPLPGCQTGKLEPGGAYAPAVTNIVDGQPVVSAAIAPDPGFFVTDSAFALAYATVDAAFQFEADNADFLWKINPAIKRNLDKIRTEALQVRNSYIAARKVYLANPTPAGLSALNTALSRANAVAAAAGAAQAEATKALSGTSDF